MGTYENPGIIQRQQATTTSQTTSNPLNRLMQVAAQRKADNQAILDANTRLYDNFANKMFEIDQFNFKDFEQNKQDLLVEVGRQYYETANKLNRGEYYVERAKTNRKGEDKTYKRARKRRGIKEGDIKYEQVHDPIAARNKLNELMMVPKQYQEVTAAFNSFVQDMDEAFSNGYLETGYVDKNYQDPRLLALYFNAKRGGADIKQSYDEEAGTLVFKFPMMTEKGKFVDADGDGEPDEYVELNAREFFLESANGENANQLVQTIPDITAKLQPTVTMLKDLVNYDDETLTVSNGKRTTTYLHLEGRNAELLQLMDKTPDLFNSTIMISKDAKNIFGVLVDKYAHKFNASEYTHKGVDLTQEYIYNTEASRKSNGEPGKNDTAIKQGQFFEKLLKTYIMDYKNGMTNPFEIDQVRSTTIRETSPFEKGVELSNEQMQNTIDLIIDNSKEDGTGVEAELDKINSELDVRRYGYQLNSTGAYKKELETELLEAETAYTNSGNDPALLPVVSSIKDKLDRAKKMNSPFVRINSDGTVSEVNENQIRRDFLDK